MTNQTKPSDIKYPSFVLALDTEKLSQMFQENTLDPKPMWYFLDGGGEHVWESSEDKPNSARINAHVVIRQRQALENNLRYLQLLPYTLIGWKNAAGKVRLSTYYRKKGHGEVRLQGSMSIGWGGHIEVIDLAWLENGDLDLPQTVLNNFEREKSEECVFTDALTGEEISFYNIMQTCEVQPQGFIRDTSNNVGLHHFALVNLLLLPENIKIGKRENEHLDGEVMEAEALLEQIDAFESWSQIIVRSYFEASKTVKESITTYQEQMREAEYHRLAAAAGQAEVGGTAYTLVQEEVIKQGIVDQAKP